VESVLIAELNVDTLWQWKSASVRTYHASCSTEHSYGKNRLSFWPCTKFEILTGATEG